MSFFDSFGNIRSFVVQGFPVVLMGRLQPWPLLRWGAGIGVAGLLSVGAVLARDQAPILGRVAISSLPAQAQAVHRAIHAAGPFAYSKDGSVFGNREGILPAQPRGYYREYTVAAPASRDRGAQRIVCGGQVPAAPVACFYTNDHYATFMRITP